MASVDSSITVHVTKFGERKFLMAYYDDPMTGRRVSRSTKETTQRAAQKFADIWEDELRGGRYKPKSNVTWAGFREDFLAARDHDLTDNGYAAFVAALNAVERHLKIDRLAELTTPRVAFLVKQLRDVDKVSDETIRSYLSHIRAALNWAKRAELLRDVPAFDMPKRTKGQKLMKGRDITAEEFERMLAKVEAGIVLTYTSKTKEPLSAERLKHLRESAKAIAPYWQRFLRGLWLSGLRLGEALTLSWDDEEAITVDMSGRHPRLLIQAGQDKSGEARLLPLASDFCEMLSAVPTANRTGAVFPLRGLSRELVHELTYVSRVICKIGEAANVVVDKASGKFASAHDLRRAFGVRWASRVMPAVLSKLMRHADISTTMKYYVGHGVETTEDAIWQAVAAQPQPRVARA